MTSVDYRFVLRVACCHFSYNMDVRRLFNKMQKCVVYDQRATWSGDYIETMLFNFKYNILDRLRST